MDAIVITGTAMLSAAGEGAAPVLNAMTAQTDFFSCAHEGKRSLHPKFPWAEASLPEPDVPWPEGAPWVDIKKYANQPAHQAVAVARMAMQISGEQDPATAHRSGAVMASGGRTDELGPLMGRLGLMAQTDPRPLATLLYQEVPDYSYLRGIPCQSGQFVCLAAGFKGSNIAVYGEAAASGLGALAFAMRMIQAGELDRMIVTAVGIPLPPQMLLAYDRDDPLGVHAGPGRGPFDRRRAGTLLGHGAVSIVIESRSTAEARRAPMLATLAACESVNAVTRDDALLMASKMVLEQAGATPDLWWAHGAGSISMDSSECHIVGPLVRAPTTGSKGTIGNLFEAAGLVDVVLATEALKRKEAPPVGFLRDPDPELGDIDFVVGCPRTLPDDADTALITALDSRVASAGAAVITALRA